MSDITVSRRAKEAQGKAAPKSLPGPTPAPSNRRRHRRISAPAVASMALADGRVAVWAVQNLSPGGASIVGDAPLTPGQRVRLSLCLPGVDEVRVSALVLRRQLATRARCALAFGPLDEATAGTLNAALEAWSHEHAGPTQVGGPFAGLPQATDLVVIDPSLAAGPTIEMSLAALGRVAFRVSSPLEAAACLSAAPDLASIMVHEELMQHEGWALMPFVRDMRPGVRRLVIPAEVSSFRLNLTLRTGLVDAVVEPPYDTATLARKVTTAEASARRVTAGP